MQRRLIWSFVLVLLLAHFTAAQEKVVIVPKPVTGTPYVVNDSTDLFAKSYRFFIEGEVDMASDSLRKLIDQSGLKLNPASYYIVVANFTDHVSPIGMFHAGSGFLDTRLYGLDSDSLYYLFVSRTENAPSFVSVMLKSKPTPFEENLPAFLQLIGFGIQAALDSVEQKTTWIDVRRFEIPDKFKKSSDISLIVKKTLEEDRYLASAVFDNTPLERWSYGIATAITTLNDIVLEIGEDGTIIVRPQPSGDLAAFGVINYHFKPVDTKAPTIASSVHLLGGLRVATHIEPVLGLGLGVPIANFALHVFAGGSLAFRNELKSGFQIGQRVLEEEDPFKLKLKAYPRFGLELKFP